MGEGGTPPGEDFRLAWLPLSGWTGPLHSGFCYVVIL
jgi:hypothetical protein